MIWPPAPQNAQKNRGAGHGAPGNDSVHWSALSFPGFQTFKQNFFHVHRAFYLEILLCRLCSFTSPAHQFGANDVTTLGYPSLGFRATFFRKAFSQFALWIKSGSCLGSIGSKLAVNRAFRSSGDLKQNSELDFPPLAVPFLKACSHAAHRPH